MLTMQQQEALVSQGLAKKKINEELGLVTYKYAKKVMYDYLWDKHPELLYCRGHVYDMNTGRLVIAAPKKSFNYLENGTWKDKPLDTPVSIYKKYNGFMACATMHDGKLLVSTTGNTSGQYVEWAKGYIQNYYNAERDRYGSWVMPHGITDLFEIIHPEDPHIVHEEVGAVFLGWTSMSNPYKFEPALDEAGNAQFTSLGEALEIVKTVKHEGFMVYDEITGEVCKLKSPYYVGKKKLMRANAKSVANMYSNPLVYEAVNLPVEWHGVPKVIVNYWRQHEWLEMDAQERRSVLEGIYD